MKNEAKSYTIELCGDTYTIVSDESQHHIDEVVSYIQQQLDGILAGGGHNKDHQELKKAAILSLLRLASELIHIKNRFHQQAQHQDVLVHQLDQLLQSLF